MYIKNNLGLVEGTETMLAQKHRLNQIANNMANVDTNGYKKEGVTFWEMLYNTTNSSERVGKAMKIVTDQSQGSFEETSNTLDFAISGPGFFRVQTAEGIRYSRNGNFALNNLNQLVTMDGNLVMGNGGSITLESDDIKVGKDGLITAGGLTVGQLSIVTFDDLSDLQKEGKNLYKSKDGNVQEQPLDTPSIQQGFLESSNVNITVEMTEMIDLQRAFQTQQKLIQTIDDLNGQAISKVGKLT